MDESRNPPADFTRRFLPWVIVIAAAVLYSMTLNHWVSLSSLLPVARVTGWDWWFTALDRPVFLLVTLPVRYLPAGSQIMALNAFSVLCSALTLGLLVRSVGLLPQDRTREQRHRERSGHSLLTLRSSWLPPVLAAAVCGLQMTFWENATNATGECFDLLLFAYIIRCLLEYRISGRESWWYRIALVYGLAAANNWAMLGFFPFFLVAFIWIKGRSFFNLKFLLRIVALGLLGLSAYLVLPAVPSLTHAPHMSFGEVLRYELGTQKNFLLLFPRWRALMLAITSVMPVLLISVRWPSSLGDTNPAATMLANFIFRVVHIALLAVILWVAFDPEFSPRQLGFGLPFLTFYYLGALAAGYFIAYLLLIFGPHSGNAWERPTPFMRMIGGLVTSLIWITAVAVPGGLIYRNWSRIEAANGPLIRQFAEQLSNSVPANNAIILSSNPQHLLLLSAARHGQAFTQPSVDLNSLARPRYYTLLQQRHSSYFPPLNSQLSITNSLSPVTIAQLVDFLIRSNDICILGPIFGQHFLEAEYLQPRGLAYDLKPYGTNRVSAPALAPEVLTANQTYWDKVIALLPQLRVGLLDQRGDITAIASYYSAGLNYWAVELQKLGKLEDAGRYFTAATDFNPGNVVARINLTVNQNLRAGKSSTSSSANEIDDKLGRYGTWDSLLRANGPIDESTACQRLGAVLGQAALRRQAVLNFLRAQILSPAELAPRKALCEAFLAANMPLEAANVVKQARASAEFHNPSLADDVELTRLEALTLPRTSVARAEEILLAADRKHPRNAVIHETLAEIYLQTHQITNALATVEKLLAFAPDNLPALITQGAVLLDLRQYDRALIALDHVLKLAPRHLGGLIYRANVHLGMGNLAAAQRDYEAALDIAPRIPSLQLGLAAVAEQQGRTAEAIARYENALGLFPAGAPQAIEVARKINALKSGGK